MWFFYDYNFLSPLHQGLLEAESQIEPELKELLSKAGADEYAPIFAKKGVKIKQLTYMNDKQLSEVLLIEKHMFFFTACIRYTEDDLRMFNIIFSHLQLGIHNAYIRQKILATLESNMEAPAAKVSDATPSAPMDNDVPSAPPAPIETFQSNECVVCMENKVLMLPFFFVYISAF